MTEAFVNEPTLELRRATVRESLTGALRDLDARPPLEVPVIVGGDEGGGPDLPSTDPAEPGRVVALARAASAADADAAVRAATTAAGPWGERSARERAGVMTRAAGIIRERRLELAALQVRECAKPWLEADADVCEAIDFLEYYAREALVLDTGRELVQVPGERNEMRYAPRGVAAVISPWNFPLAIPLGMAAAALVTGNAVVLKPAEQSPGSALMLVRILHEAGVPPGALALLPGFGEAGAALVRNPGVHVIAFTGSQAVGLEIVRAAAEPAPGQHHVKRVVAEMGGKNCAIVDADADLDDAVPAIVRSAYGYAGQKCSAAARVLCHEGLADRLAERIAGAVGALEVGPPESFATQVPPVIDEEARDRVLRYAEIAESEGRIAARGAEGPGGGWYAPPLLAADLPKGSAVITDEIFGPLLTLERVPGIDAAFDLVRAAPVALTAGLFSRSPETVRRAVSRLPVGNLYVNRHITGAVVGRQPFGGNRLSGVGSKAGGPDYLLQFVEPRVVSENTMRHGLVVD